MERWDLARVNEGKGRGMEGVIYRRRIYHGISVHSMEIRSEEAANSLCKPIGMYYTIPLKSLLNRRDDGFIEAAQCIARLLRQLMPKRNKVLIACLGNPNITPDAVGPRCAEHLMVTRHLKAYLPETFCDFGEVSLICPGVLGTTGIESAMLVRGAVEAVQPDAVIAVDALAARSTNRLCSTIQLCSTGVEPGSGVGNRRYAINEETLGVPVIGAGVPTVVDAGTLIADLTGELSYLNIEGKNNMMVTPREIDSLVADCAKLLAYGINFALHDDISLEDIDLFVS